MSKRKLADISNPNADICDFIFELANFEKNVNRNVHKYNAYRKASNAISKHQSRLLSGEEAKKLEGVGKQIGLKIDEFLATGKLAKLEKIRGDDNSQAINNFTRVTGIGPAKASDLVRINGLKTIEDLKLMCVKDSTLLNHHQKIGLKHFEDFESRIPRQEIEAIREYIFNRIDLLDSKFRHDVCGSFRRQLDSSGDVDVLVSHPDYSSTSTKLKGVLLKSIVDDLIATTFITDTLSLGDVKFMGVCRLLDSNELVRSPTLYRRLDIRIVPYDEYPCALLYFTGSDMFNKEMRGHALEQGFTLNEYSLRPLGSTGKPGESIPVEKESDLFDFINFPYKEPRER